MRQMFAERCVNAALSFICGILFNSGINDLQLNGSGPQQPEFYAFGHFSYAGPCFFSLEVNRADMLYVHIRVSCGQTCHLGANQL